MQVKLDNRSINHAGFSMIELMVALAVVAMLVAVAMPSYTAFVKRSERTDGTKALAQLANQQEQYYVANQSYANNISDLPMTALTEGGNYRLSVVSGNAAAYVLQADPAGTGTSGTLATDGKLRINSFGVKRWDCGNDGSYSCDWEDAARK